MDDLNGIHMDTTAIELIKSFIRQGGAAIFGRRSAAHRIPFGPIKGRFVFMSFGISPRMYFGIDEPWVCRLAQEHIRPGDIVYDIGAHVGYTAVLFATLSQASGHVHAFEILPSTTAMLRKTVEANGLTNITVHGFGLGLREQELELPVGNTAMTSIYSHASGSQTVEKCTVDSLDQYIARSGIPAPSFIKIDIEGAEIDCLEGGVQTITKHSPRMIVEFHSGDLFQRGYELLGGWNYQLISEKGPIANAGDVAHAARFPQNFYCVRK